jgi:Fe2+ transport system protein FeoA
VSGLTDDLRERLEGFGYGPDDDLSLLHYALLPTIDPLDTELGAAYVVDAAVQRLAGLN